jgi:glycine dehydrogenase subunit 1
MAYLPHADPDRAAMLLALGLHAPADMFRHLPAELLRAQFRLPAPLSELELTEHLQALAGRNNGTVASHCFLGAGAYRRFSPAIVDAVISRPEFYTAYTPYQAEASQGWLQAIYEYQSMIALLTGLDVANASMYDGASALAEAAMMAAVQTDRHTVLVAETLHPEYRQVLETYSEGRGLQVRPLPARDGTLDLRALDEQLTPDTAAVLVQQPNFFGQLEPVQRLVQAAHSAGALVITCVDPVSLGVLASPGDCGADIAVGDGQPLGIPLSYGGPYVGFMATRTELVRRLPGRLVGMTTDHDGRTGFVLTLQAREQHIRREHATSNICTNHALIALAATVYLARMGGEGLRRIATLSAQRAHHLAKTVSERPGYRLAHPGPFLWEFVLQCPRPAEEVAKAMEAKGIVAGLPLGRFFKDRADCLLVAVTEMNDPPALRAFVEALP